MPQNREERLAKKKEYREKNKVKLAKDFKEWWAKNSDRRIVINKQWKANNQDKCKITSWKAIGIIDTDMDLLYEVFMKETKCWICDVEFSKSNHKCLDHDHSIKDGNNVRYICCRNCNLHIIG